MAALNVQQLVLPDGAPTDATDAMTFRVAAGQIGALFGRPDSGIREVLRIIAGLEPAARGEVRLDDIPVHTLPTERRRIGLVQRDSVLFPGSAADNIAFGLKRLGWPKGDRSRRVAEVLELVGMAGAEDDRVDILTEGERARILLARAIAPAPAALLVESPTWYVPEVDRITFRGRLREVFQSLEIPVLISTHDVQDVVGIADDLLVVHDGQLHQAGSVSRVLAGPNSIEVAELVGYVTLIRGEVHDGEIVEAGAGAVAFPAGFPLQGTARALAHPAVMLGVPESSGLGCGVAGTLERVRAIGPTYLLDLRVGDRTVEVRWEWDLAPPDAEDVIGIAVPPGTLRFFNEPAGAGELPPGRAEGEGQGAPAGLLASLGDRATDEPPRDDRATEEALRPAAAASETDPLADAEDPGDVAADVSTDDRTDDRTDEGAATGLEPADPGETEPGDNPSRVPVADVPEFRPSEGLMAEPAGDGAATPPIAYDPEDDAGIVHEPLVGSPAPAPAPPRTRTAEDGARDEVEDDSVGLMAPWLQVSKPPGEDAPPPRDPHRGMPLD